MISGVWTPDGKFTEVLADFGFDPVQVATVVDVCRRRGALDLLPMLGVSE